VLEKIGEIVDRDGSHVAWEHQTTLYKQDEIVPDSKISPLLVKAYDEEDEHTISVLEYVDEEVEVKPARKPRPRAKAKEETVVTD
jgi:hypothetical protein